MNNERSSAGDNSDQQQSSQDFTTASMAMFSLLKDYVNTVSAATRSQQTVDPLDLINPWVISKAFMKAGEKMLQEPMPYVQLSQKYCYDAMDLWAKQFTKGNDDDCVESTTNQFSYDKRFKDDDWHQNSIFKFLLQSYKLWDRWLSDIVDTIPDLDTATHHKVQFYTRQLINALSPNNSPFSNPQVIKETIQTHGQNLVQGMQNFIKDLQQGQGKLKISMVDRSAFTVGKNIATTPGKVIFQNDLLQLIYYTPATDTVYEIPILLIPPCINKFYIYDLREENSFVRWLLYQGFAVFMISWVNPTQELAHKTFENYVLEGVGTAIETVKDICQVQHIHAIGFCIGGNFLVSYAAYLSALKSKDLPLKTTTYLATLFDFTNAGDLLVFIDEEQIEVLKRTIKQRGYINGETLGLAFNLLRANDLIWSFFINNYLLGREPQAFDLLFWNADSTNLPAAMYIYYLENFFLKNLLIQPGQLFIKDQPLDIGAITIPTFVLNTREDHIAPWHCGYKGAQKFAGPTRFVLGGSGHIAGIFNHPQYNKYQHWTGDMNDLDAEPWFNQAEQQSGSWWTTWIDWLKPQSGDKIVPVQPDLQRWPTLEDAPGSYVL